MGTQWSLASQGKVNEAGAGLVVDKLRKDISVAGDSPWESHHIQRCQMRPKSGGKQTDKGESPIMVSLVLFRSCSHPLTPSLIPLGLDSQLPQQLCISFWILCISSSSPLCQVHTHTFTLSPFCIFRKALTQSLSPGQCPILTAGGAQVSLLSSFDHSEHCIWERNKLVLLGHLHLLQKTLPVILNNAHFSSWSIRQCMQLPCDTQSH